MALNAYGRRQTSMTAHQRLCQTEKSIETALGGSEENDATCERFQSENSTSAQNHCLAPFQMNSKHAFRDRIGEASHVLRVLDSLLFFLGPKLRAQFMDLEHVDFQQIHTAGTARARLIKLLQDAHAGEKAAALAYLGHGHSLFVTSEAEKVEILRIQKEELHHRERLNSFLQILGSKPRVTREVLMRAIGAAIAVFSYFGIWIIPMYGAGRLERSNIGEYEVAARLAHLAGAPAIIDELLYFAEVEWDHECYFRKKVESHYLSRWIPMWSQPKPRDEIQKSFREFRV